MTYATPQDMIAQYGEREMLAIADPDDTGDVDLAKVQLALDSASDQIDFSAGQRCALPLVINTPAVATFLKQLCMDIARYRMTGSSGVTATDEVKDRYKEADGNLKLIMSGKIILCAQSGDGIVSGGQGLQPESLTAGEAESEGAGRMFNAEKLHDFMGRLK